LRQRHHARQRLSNKSARASALPSYVLRDRNVMTIANTIVPGSPALVVSCHAFLGPKPPLRPQAAVPLVHRCDSLGSSYVIEPHYCIFGQQAQP